MREHGAPVFCDLETERFMLRRVNRFEAFRLTAPWRRDGELLEGLFQSSRPRSLVSWWFTGPRSNGRTHFAHAIVPKSGGGPIGLHVVVQRRARPTHCHVGIADRTWWGKNVVVEVRARLIEHFFACGAERFAATIVASNAASIFNYRKLGFRLVGSTTGPRDRLTGARRPAVQFELSPEDWRAGTHGGTR